MPLKSYPALLWTICIAVLFPVGTVPAGENLKTPIYVANQNPFVQIYGLPKFEGGTVTPKGRLELGFMFYVSNNAFDAQDENSSIIWDAEVAEYLLQARYGLFDWLELGMDAPLVDISGGYLDSLIQHTHKLWTMPNTRQDAFEKNSLHLQYIEGGVTNYTTKSRATGLGDIRITGAIPLIGGRGEADRSLALRSVLKLPTGDADKLLGSGGVDVSVGLSFTDVESLSAWNLYYALQGGAVLTGDSDLFSNQEDAIGYAGVHLGWQAFRELVFKAQFDYHTAFYDSALAQLGSSIQLTVGGTAELPGRILMDAGMSQNMSTDATPDVGFYLTFRHLF
jgi:hypothetical protein